MPDLLDVAKADQAKRLESIRSFQLATFLQSPTIADLSIADKTSKIADFVLRRSGAIINARHFEQIANTLRSDLAGHPANVSKQILKDLVSVPITLEEFKTIETDRAKIEKRTHPTLGDR